MAGPALPPRGPCYFVGARTRLCPPPPPPPVPEGDQHECVRLVCEQRGLAAPHPTQGVLLAPAVASAVGRPPGRRTWEVWNRDPNKTE